MSKSYDVCVIGSDLSSGLIALECQKKGFKTLWLHEEELSLGQFDKTSQTEQFCEFLPETPETRYLLPWVEELIDEVLHVGFHNLSHWAIERTTKDTKPFLWKSSSKFLYEFFLKPRGVTLKSFPSHWLEKTKLLFQGDKKLRCQISSLTQREDKSFSLLLNEKEVISKYIFWASSLSGLRKFIPQCKIKKQHSPILSVLYFNWSHKVPLNENPYDVFYLLNSLQSNHPEVAAMVKFKDSQTSQWLSLVEDIDPSSVVVCLQKIKKMIQKVRPQWYESVSKEFIGLKPYSYGHALGFEGPQQLYFVSPISCGSEGILAYIQPAFESLKLWDKQTSSSLSSCR